MELTEDLKAKIDAMSLEELMRKWRFAPAGDPMFQGESGQYYAHRLARLKAENHEAAVGASKRIGWD